MSAHKRFLLFIFCTIYLSLFLNISKIAADELELSCKESLSKNARIIHDRVIEKRLENSDLKELWKGITRELITENIFGREDAMSPAKEAYHCLEKRSINSGQ